MFCVSDLSVFLGSCGVDVFMDATLGLCIVSDLSVFLGRCVWFWLVMGEVLSDFVG